MRMAKKPGLELGLVSAWFLAYAGWEGFVVTQWHQFYWWLPIFWVLICLTWFYCNRAVVRSRRMRESADLLERRFQAARETIIHRDTRDSWLAESARWPDPWSHHDLDYPESKELSSRSGWT